MSETNEERLKRLLGVLDEELPDEEEARATVERLGINVPAMAERIQDLVAGRSVCIDGEGARLSLYPEVWGLCADRRDEPILGSHKQSKLCAACPFVCFVRAPEGHPARLWWADQGERKVER